MLRSRIQTGVVLVAIDDPGQPDLALVEQLAALALCARRHGLAMRVTPVTPALRDLLERCGLDGVVLGAGCVEELG